MEVPGDLMERTINEPVEYEERDRNEYRPMFNVDHLDSDERCC